MENKDIHLLVDLSRKLGNIRTSFYSIDVNEISFLSESEIAKFYIIRKFVSDLTHDVCMRCIDSL